jgi:hypothetical protein
MEASLRDMLKYGRKFERLKIDDLGVYVRKIPQSKDGPAYLALEINPADEGGNPMNKMGIIIRSKEQLDSIREILSQETVDDLVQAIEGVNQRQA